MSTWLQATSQYEPLGFVYPPISLSRADQIKDPVLQVFNTLVLIRVCIPIFGSRSGPGCAEARWTVCADIAVILSAIFGGIFLMLAYGQNRECGTGNCGSFRSSPVDPSPNIATCLLYAVSYVVNPTTPPPPPGASKNHASVPLYCSD